MVPSLNPFTDRKVSHASSRSMVQKNRTQDVGGMGTSRLARTFFQHHNIILLKREQGIGIHHNLAMKFPLESLKRFGLGILQHLHDMRMSPNHHGLLSGGSSDSSDIAKTYRTPP